MTSTLSARRVLSAALLFSALVPAVASAQLTRNGSSIGLHDVLTWGTDSCYDPNHQTYLVVHGQGEIYGVFENTAGNPASNFFRIGSASSASDSVYGLFPRCVYSPDVNNGAGGFLVTWLQSLPTTVRAVIVGDPNGATSSPPMSAEQIITPSPNAHSSIGGPAVAYSATSKQFMVTWPTSAFDINARFINLAGQGTGSAFTILAHSASTGAIYPAITWNSRTDEFAIAYSRFNDASKVGLVRIRRVSANGTLSNEHDIWSGNGFVPEIQYNPGTRRYFLGWSVPPGSQGAEVDENGNVVRQGLISSRVGTASNFALGFNPVSGTFAAVSEDNNSNDVAGLELNTNGIAKETAKAVTNGGGTKGSFWPRVTPRTDAKEWNVTFARQFTSTAAQILSTTSSEGVAVSNVQMNIDGPGNGSIFRSTETITIQGWAVDRAASSGTGIDAIHIYAFPQGSTNGTFLAAITSFSNRGDVGGLLGAQFANSGFAAAVTLPLGSYTINAYPHSTVTGAFGAPKSINVTVAASLPLMSVDTPRNNSTVSNSITLSGWALDKFAGSGQGTGVVTIHVWAFPASGPPQFFAQATLGGSRTDVGAVFGSQFNTSGFSATGTLPAGSYQLVAYLYSGVSNSWALSQGVNMTVSGPVSAPVASLDSPGTGTVALGANIGGWAIDTGAPSGTGVDAVHVWAFNVNGGETFVGAASLGFLRGDVGGIYGSQFTPSGFNLTLAGLSQGQTYDLAVYARSSVSGNFNMVKVVRITIAIQ